MTKQQISGQSTTSVRQGQVTATTILHEVDAVALGNYLAQHISGFTTPIEIRQFSLGQSNPTFLVQEAGGARYVIRKKPPGQLLSNTAHAVEREFRVLDALGRHTDVPVPRVFHLCEDTSVLGTPFYVMEFVKGRIFSDVRFNTLAPEERRACWLSVVETLAKLHLADYRAIGLADYGRPSDFYARQIRSLQRVSAAQAAVVDSATGKAVGPIPRLDEMLAWFSRNAVADRTTIVHGDFKVDNVVFHPTEPRVIAILDWELSTIGHPLSDLANLLQPYYASIKGVPMMPAGLEGNQRPEGVPSADELIKHYCELTAQPYPIRNWMFSVAFSFFRLSVITQGIAARVAKGQASSAQATEYAKLFRPVAQFGLRIVDAGELTDVSSKL
ncbi:kinase-like domain-containing protein [Thamnocephalis sphaerospora]|uniref:Kinase-like domain-containing protein n=1 Tax=Thamnocephalis sphaerospora TaxID=78915 RepID=A0A4P9XUZ4_9FUNG|nr:kinase-like domain-containing protein [Thamnocephalis sphaerospora]|eukprot:RKP09401.1 kinase-like domain-containing protein [Thamnocephalis sphaerospora]